MSHTFNDYISICSRFIETKIVCFRVKIKGIQKVFGLVCYEIGKVMSWLVRSESKEMSIHSETYLLT